MWFSNYSGSKNRYNNFYKVPSEVCGEYRRLRKLKVEWISKYYFKSPTCCGAQRQTWMTDSGSAQSAEGKSVRDNCWSKTSVQAAQTERVGDWAGTKVSKHRGNTVFTARTLKLKSSVCSWVWRRLVIWQLVCVCAQVRHQTNCVSASALIASQWGGVHLMM